MTTTPTFPRLAAWIIGIATAMLLAGYLTADQWLGLITSLLR